MASQPICHGKQVKLLIYSLPLLTFALLGILLEEERAALVFLGSMCLVISLTVSLWNTTSLLKIVFAALAFHALFGLIVAEPSSEAIWIGGDPRQVYDTAFFIISLGLLAATFGFRFGRRRQVQLPVLNEERFRTITRRLALLAAVGMFAAYASLGALPWQIDILSIGSTRFVTGMTEWMIHRFMDVLTVTVAALFLYGKREKFYGIIGFFALLMPFRRATVMAVLLLAVLTWCVRRGRFKPLIVAMALAVSVYASSQILFLGLLRRDFDK